MAIAPLGKHLREMNAYVPEKPCERMFITIIAKTCKQLKCHQQINRQINYGMTIQQDTKPQFLKT